MEAEDAKKKHSFNLKKLGWVLPICLVMAGFFFILQTSHFTSQTKFCMSCHEMNDAVATWEESPHGSNSLGIIADCEDCHIPRGTASMLVTKVQKLSEPYVHFIVRPNEFEFKSMQADRAFKARSQISDDNCRACHDPDREQTDNEAQMIAHATSVNQVQCVSCHRYIGHQQKSEGEGNTDEI
ncbi:cytochrome c3 family protein [Syntrophomonas erecta subsp. sporosyntropha]